MFTIKNSHHEENFSMYRISTILSVSKSSATIIMSNPLYNYCEGMTALHAQDINPLHTVSTQQGVMNYIYLLNNAGSKESNCHSHKVK